MEKSVTVPGNRNHGRKGQGSEMVGTGMKPRRERLVWGLLCLGLVSGVVLGSCGTTWVLLRGFRNRGPGRIKFYHKDTKGHSQYQASISVEGGTVSVSLVGRRLFVESDDWGFPERTELVIPYIDIHSQGLDPGKLSVDPRKVALSDTQGHRFTISGRVPYRAGVLRLAVHEGEFNRQVKYNLFRPRLKEKDKHKEYTLSLSVPFLYDGKEHKIEIPRLLCSRLRPL